jgi:hypothetical protein
MIVPNSEGGRVEICKGTQVRYRIKEIYGDDGMRDHSPLDSCRSQTLESSASTLHLDQS